MDWRDYVGPVHEAACAIGLAPRETQFFELPPADLNALAAYGLPGMYHHWRFGRDYFRIRQSHERGWSQLYEVVFNLDPAQAFVSSQGSEAAKVFVVAHVMGHVDLFEQNLFCAEQRTDMDRFLLSAQRRFDRYEELYGEEAVEHTFDVAHMLRQHVRPGRARHPHDESTERRPYDDLFGASPPATPMEAERRRRLEREYESTDIGQDDLLAFMAAQAPLEPWQRDVLMCVREVALYFRPQMLTKVVHEGYASWSHLRILRELELPFEWAIEHAKMHAGVARPHEQGAPNPYWLGLLLLEHAENKGRSVRETASVESDSSLIYNWLDEELIRETPALLEAMKSLSDEQVGEKPRWQALRDLLGDLYGPAPEVEVSVRSHTRRRLVLQANLKLDTAYAQQVADGLAWLWQGEVEIEGPEAGTLVRAGAAS